MEMIWYLLLGFVLAIVVDIFLLISERRIAGHIDNDSIGIGILVLLCVTFIYPILMIMGLMYLLVKSIAFIIEFYYRERTPYNK